MATLHEDQYTCSIIFRSILFGMRNLSDEYGRQNQNPHSVFSNSFFEKRAVYGIMWKTIVDPDCPHIAKYAVYLRIQTHTRSM
jgi:hypothetical protein